MVDALIVGAGPTGLTLGCELIKRGLSVRLIEQLAKPTDQSRALALHARTLEVFEKMGILREFLIRGLTVRKANLYFNKKRIGGIDFSHLIAPYPFILVLPQSETEQILAMHFEKLGGKIQRGVTLKEVSPTQARLLHADGREEILSPTWTFGCDGAHSTVRRSLNLPFDGTKFPESFALADVEADTSLSHEQAHMFFTAHADAALFPLPKKNWFRLILLTPEKEIDHPPQLTLSHFQTHIDALSGGSVELLQTSWMTAFSVHRRITPKMRIGNIFLLGDAAHIHSPFGGQGLNTSVQDAFNLAWKIDLVHRGVGQEILLESFEKERHPVAKSVLRHTTIGTKVISSSFLKRCLVPLMGFLSNLPGFQRAFTNQISELDISYPRSPIIDYRSTDKKWKGPLPGQRAPDANLAGNKRLFELLCHPLHTLLCFGGSELDPLVQQITRTFAPTIRTVHLFPSEMGDADSIYHASLPCIYLIRPDGIISYRSRSLDPHALLSYLSTIFQSP
ncbi:MAG: FAD-dependent monooxygenase [Verrucomicrobia bacterium]|nr:FAD-dependent monooxygenase [Verrucomicrobiota bacterium]